MATTNKEQGPRACSPTEEDYATLARAGGRKGILVVIVCHSAA